VAALLVLLKNRKQGESLNLKASGAGSFGKYTKSCDFRKKNELF
jgi:hypothetical protein